MVIFYIWVFPCIVGNGKLTSSNLSSKWTLLYMWLKYYTQRTEHKALLRIMYKANCQQIGENNRLIQCSGKTDSIVLANKEKIMNKILYQ